MGWNQPPPPWWVDVGPGVVNVKENHDLGAAQREPKGVQAGPGDGGLGRDAGREGDVVGGVSEKRINGNRERVLRGTQYL